MNRAACVLRCPFVVVAFALLAAGCTGGPSRSANSSESPVQQLARDLIAHTCRFQPTVATNLGLHDHDEQLEDYSRAEVIVEVEALQRLRGKLAAVNEPALPLPEQLDLELMRQTVAARILTLDVMRPWASNPDVYSSGVTNTAYLMIKRSFASPATRLRRLVQREKAMPAVFAAAKQNLANPPRILTEIALEQLDGNRDLFATAVPAAFAAVDDPDLLAEFRQANAAVLAAFDDYKTWLQVDLLPRSKGNFALGAETYQQKLWVDEMLDVPLAELLRVAEADLHKNQAAFAEVAHTMDPQHSPAQVLAALQLDHPPANELFATTQSELDSLAQFLTEHHIVTVPAAAPARVEETPPFLRATTSASMDTPGPFETEATEAFYSMTLPDPAGTAEATAEFMKQWYFASISNVSVHEVWPGHYLQFLYEKQLTSDARRTFGVNTNSEGWAHYCEQMVLDEGLHAGLPKYRLAQLQDALLRDARCIVGIRMHTQGWTVEQGKQFFVTDGYQPLPVAEIEAKRGTTDPTYGYYTLGKLMILKLRADYQTKTGATFHLQDFHDAFLRLGPLPLPLIRRAMLGEAGRVL